jgi:hypothetical protein
MILNDLHKVDLEIFKDGDIVVINIKFQATGEIRQKRVSVNWLFNKLFSSQIKTMKKYNEELIVDNLFLR